MLIYLKLNNIIITSVSYDPGLTFRKYYENILVKGKKVKSEILIEISL